MRVRRAQSLLPVRREIDDEEAAARPQGARGLANGAQGIVEIMQDLMHDDEILGTRFDRHRVNIALAQMHIAQTRAFDARACDAQHVRRLIDADGAGGARREEFKHPPGSSAEIEQGMGEAIGSEAGFLVPPTFSMNLFQRMYASGTLLSFILNARFNFRVTDRILQRLICFFCVAFLGWLMSAGLLNLFIGHYHFNPYASKLVTLGFVVVLQYTLNRFISFRKAN